MEATLGKDGRVMASKGVAVLNTPCRYGVQGMGETRSWISDEQLTQGMTSSIKTNRSKVTDKLRSLHLYRCMVSMSRTTVRAVLFPLFVCDDSVRFYTTHSISAVLDKTVMTDYFFRLLLVYF